MKGSNIIGLFVAELIVESLSNHYEYDSDYGWRSIEPSAHAPVVIPLSLSDSTSVLVR